MNVTIIVGTASSKNAANMVLPLAANQMAGCILLSHQPCLLPFVAAIVPVVGGMRL